MIKSEWSGQLEKLGHKYRLHSIFFQNLKQLVALLLIPLLVVCVLVYFGYRYLEENEMKETYETMLVQLETDLDEMIQTVQSQITQIAFNSDVEQYMNGGSVGEQFELEDIQEQLKLSQMLQTGISSICLYAHESEKVVTSGGMFDYYLFYDKDMLENYYRSLKKQDRRLATTVSPNGKTMQISVYQEVHYSETVEGLIVINCDLSDLVAQRGGKETVYLVEGDRILYATQTGMEGLDSSTIPGYNECGEGQILMEDGHCIAKSKMDNENVWLAVYSQNTEFNRKMSQIRSVLIWTILGASFLMVVACIRVSRRIFQPIQLILREIEKNSLTLSQSSDQLPEKNELHYILKSIQRSAHNTQTIESQLAERIRLLKQAQSVALQSQINPHFLNNTLETINWLAIDELGPENDISEMMEHLSAMFRMTLEDTGIVIPIQIEMEHAWHYIQIQKTRYGDRFDLEWKISEQLYPYKTIRIVLQPLIENAIYHGIKRMQEKGKIIVGGKLENELVHLWVEDNGPGMTPEELERLKQNMNSEDIHASRHIGTANVNQRVRLYFGENYGVVVQSTLGQGCRFEVIFPAIR